MAGLARQMSLKDYWGGAPGLIRKLPLATSQTYVEGDLLIINGSGALTICATGGTVAGNVPSGTKFAGVANVPAVNDLGASYGWGQFTMWQPGLQILMPLVYVNGSNAIVAASSVFNPNLIGNNYEINYSQGYPCVDINHTSNAFVKIVDVWAEDYPLWGATNGAWPTGAGTVQYPWVWCECLSTCALLW